MLVATSPTSPRNPVGDLWVSTRVSVDNLKLSTELHGSGFSTVRAWGNRCAQTSGTYAGQTQGCAQSTALITSITLVHHPLTRKGTL